MTFKLRKRTVENLFSRHLHGSDCTFRCARILEFSAVYKLSVSLYMFKIFKCDMYLSIRNSLQITEISHSYSTRFNTCTFISFVRVEKIRMIYKYQLAKFGKSIPLLVHGDEAIYELAKNT